MRKFLPYIIGYTIYASIVLVCISDISRREYWDAFIIWEITLPLVVGCISHYVKKHYFSNIGDDTKNTDPTAQDEDTVKSIFLQDWSLIEFAKEHGPKMGIKTLTNSKTGKEFNVCVFITPIGKETSVRFFSQLGELTSAEISQRKNELKVGMMDNGKFYLHDANTKAWEDVDLGI